MSYAPQKRQRHGASRGVLVDHRGIKATREFYSATRAPSPPSNSPQQSVRAVVPIDAVETHTTRLAPYGKEVVAAGGRGNVYLFAGADAWTRAKVRREARGPGSVMVLPPGDDPTAYHWPVVPNGVLIVALGEPRVRVFATAQAVVSCGTPMAFAVFGGNEALIVRTSNWRTLERAA